MNHTQRNRLMLMPLMAVVTSGVLWTPLPLLSGAQVYAQVTQGNSKKADQIFQQGIQQYKTSQFRAALQSWELALKLYRQIGDRQGEANSLGNLGNAYDSLGQYKKAISFHQQHLDISRQIGDRQGEANSLGNLGNAYHSLGQYKKAISFHQQHLDISRQIGYREGEAASLGSLGNAYSNLGQYEKAISFHQQDLDISRQIGDRLGEAGSLNNLGNAYSNLGQYKKAISFHQQSLDISRQIGNRQGEANSLGNLGNAYDSLGQYKKAISFHQQYLDISRQIGNRQGEANSLGNLGNAYSNLGQYKKAISFHQQHLDISRQIGDRQGEAQSLGNLGNAYHYLGQYKKAISFHQQHLDISRQIGDRLGEAASLGNLGNAYHSLGQYKKAISFHQQHLDISRQIGDRLGEAISLGNLGNAYDSLGQYEKAIDHYQQSLTLSQAMGARHTSGIVFSNLGRLLAEQQQPELAIIFYKQSVNLREQIRKDLKGLPQQEQQSYTDSVANSYRRLADLLLQQDRVLEAQTVLDLLKVQELDDYLRGVRGTGKQLDFLQPELQILARYNESQKSAIALIQELDALTKLAQSGPLTDAQTQRRNQLINLRQDLQGQFTEFLRQPQIKALLTQLSRDTTRESIDLASLSSLQNNLANVQGALLSPLILEDRLELVLTTPNAPPLRRVVQVKRTDLNRAIVAYRQALQDPSTDARPLAQQLYTWLIEPIAADLKQANIKNILYAPDGQLRYIPLAALHDGQQWLTQSYQVTNITTTSSTDFDTKPQANPRILAGAFADDQMTRTVTAGQKTQEFKGLPFAGVEVNTLVAARPNTTALMDQNLTLEQTLQQMDLHQIIHLATHAAFVPSAPEDSFIVFGEGKNPTLLDIANWPLKHVDLVILSACETAVGGFGNGAEVLGLGYQFQRSGSKAVIASLWQVSDGGTQALITEFYGALQPGTTKAEALRQAQVALITKGQKVEGEDERTSVDFNPGNSPSKAGIARYLSHPYYWAPFILIGNGL
ncbi:CHAT domain-containing protein [Acaryochloris marina NIES-2412]|uniref:CHAT domain-containing protein n=1 Tax=Acaryochloris marina TaxID=155978 RepID=UPI0040594D87